MERFVEERRVGEEATYVYVSFVYTIKCVIRMIQMCACHHCLLLCFGLFDILEL